jgi:hypothetical protein
VLQGDDLEPGSPHTSVGSVHSFVDEDFCQNPHDDGVVDNIKVIQECGCLIRLGHTVDRISHRWNRKLSNKWDLACRS